MNHSHAPNRSHPRPLGRPIRTILSIVLATLTAATSAPAETPLELALDSVTQGDLARHINTLASDSLQGRSAGTDGGRAAGSYLVHQLHSSGLEGAGVDKDFYQEFSEKGFRNVLAVLPGNDPKLKNRYIVIGAHYDHVGLGAKTTSLGALGQIHNGADDNASGTAAVLEVAQALAQTRGLARGRSILFVFWDAEELGLLGSKHWTNHPTIPVSSIDMALNVDMVGRLRNSKLFVYGSRSGAGLRQLAAQPNALLKHPLAIQFDWDLKANSDHHPLFAKGVPVLFLHTGLHENYHRPSDDANLIAYDGLETITRLMIRLTLDAACKTSLPEYRQAAAVESEDYRHQLESAALTAQQRLGATWDEDLAQQGIIRLTRVSRNTAADNAKLKKGDRLLELAGWEINDVDEFSKRLLAADSTIAVVTQRRKKKKQPTQTTLSLPGDGRRLGFEWYTDEAEPKTVIVRGVVPTSPADRAGLKDADRILALDGRSIASVPDLRKRLNRPSAAMTLQVERQGRFQAIRFGSPTTTAGTVSSADSSRDQDAATDRDQ